MATRGPRPLRTATLAVLVIGAFLSLFVGLSLFPEARFAFEGQEPTDIGAFTTAELPAALEGRYVRARVDLAGQPGLAFRRLGEEERRLVRTAPDAADQDSAPRFVEHAVPASAGAQFIPPRLVAGRLSRVGTLGLRHRGLARPLDRAVPDSSRRGWVIVDGESPHAARWVAGIDALVFAFFVWNVASVARIVRRRPAA